MTSTTLPSDISIKQFLFYCENPGHSERLKTNKPQFQDYNQRLRYEIIEKGFLLACSKDNLDIVKIMVSDKFYGLDKNLDTLYAGIKNIFSSMTGEDLNNNTKFDLLNYLFYQSPLDLARQASSKTHFIPNLRLLAHVCIQGRSYPFKPFEYLADFIEKNMKTQDGCALNALTSQDYHAFKMASACGSYHILEGMIKRYTITGREPFIKKILVDNTFSLNEHDIENLKLLMIANFEQLLLTKEIAPGVDSKRINKI